LEFFGSVALAVPAIVEITNLFKPDAQSTVLLAGLEHLDERYLKAVGYATKANRAERPKMVLIADIASDDEAAAGTMASHIVRLANARGGEGFIAVSADARKKFWLDRARTAAIAAHTNAFKINEDVVIPLDRLADYSDGVERINIELSINNKLRLLDALEAFIRGELPLVNDEDTAVDAEMVATKREFALTHIARIRQHWVHVLQNLDSPLNTMANIAQELLVELGHGEFANVFRAVQEHRLRVSWKRNVRKTLHQIFAGRAYAKILERCDEIHRTVLKSRVFVALHMHAGDGNVHTNIPVNSDDYAMLQEANHAVARIMALATSLGGVISGEHGIGITKLEFLDDKTISDFADYKHKVDPDGRFNKGKLMAGADLRNAYTPSFGLLELESLIMEQSEIGEIADSIKDCLRCGKCKPVCTTHRATRQFAVFAA